MSILIRGFEFRLTERACEHCGYGNGERAADDAVPRIRIEAGAGAFIGVLCLACCCEIVNERNDEQSQAAHQKRITAALRASELDAAREAYFEMGGTERELGPRDEPTWYWRRAFKLARARLEDADVAQRDTESRAAAGIDEGGGS